MLGSLEVLDNGGHPVELRGSKLRTLLAALVLRAGQPVSADQLADLLWGDAPPSGAANALQAQVSKLRRSLVGVPLEGRDGGYVLLDRPPRDRLPSGSLDSPQQDTSTWPAIATPKPPTTLREALALWRGPALADFAFDEFAQTHRTRLEEMRLAATEDRIDADLAEGRHEAVAAELEGLVREHGLRERLWGQLMLALYRCDRQSESLRAYQRARDLLADELGLDPGPALRELERQVLAQDPALAAPVLTSRAPLGLSNIYPELSTFVGRTHDVAHIVELLRSRRLVSVIGPGGVGKTRIATETALRPDRLWRDGTWLVELGLDTGERAVSAAFQRTFGPRLGHTGGDAALDWLTTGLSATELLIVLDNCEHVLPEAAAAVSAILRSCPGVSVLATSREPLGVSGECVRVLDPLELDDAIDLFASRAADSDGEFVLDDSSAASVATICTNVDRLPLAIELTAARTRAFTAQQLADLLDQRFGLVSTANSGRPQRQRTMHAAVDWSFDLLFEDERRVLTRLSVFAGGFTLDAAATGVRRRLVVDHRDRGALGPAGRQVTGHHREAIGGDPTVPAPPANSRLRRDAPRRGRRNRADAHSPHQLADRSHGWAHRRPARQVDGRLGSPCRRRTRQPCPGGRVGSRRGRPRRNASDRGQPQLVCVPQCQPAQRRAGTACSCWSASGTRLWR